MLWKNSPDPPVYNSDLAFTQNPHFAFFHPALFFFTALNFGPCCSCLPQLSNIKFTCYFLLFPLPRKPHKRETFNPIAHLQNSDQCLVHMRDFKNSWINEWMNTPNSRDLFLFSNPAMNHLPLHLAFMAVFPPNPVPCTTWGAFTGGGLFGSSSPTTLWCPVHMVHCTKEVFSEYLLCLPL